jgi:hypothetical protein
MADNLSAPISNKTIDPSNASDATKKFMSPNAKDDPECISGDNPQKAWRGGSGKPKAPFGQRGTNF